MARTPTQFLIESAALKFAKWNHKALRLEASVPTATDIRDWQKLDGLHAEGLIGPAYIVREPMTAHQALEATAQELAAAHNRAPQAEKDTLFKINHEAVLYYVNATEGNLEAMIEEVHEVGMELLDIQLSTDNIFVSAMGDLEALGAAARVFRGQGRGSQDDLDLALKHGLVDWFIEVGLIKAIPSWKFVEWERSYEVRPIGGVLPRSPKVLMRKFWPGRYQSDKAERL